VQNESFNYIQESPFLTQTVQCKDSYQPLAECKIIIRYLVSHYGCLNPTFDPLMSFRDRHRFLDGVYNAHSGPENISAKNLEIIAKDSGLLMEEVLSWFEDEKSRRAVGFSFCYMVP